MGAQEWRGRPTTYLCRGPRHHTRAQSHPWWIQKVEGVIQVIVRQEEGDMPEAKVKVRRKVLLVACPRGSTKR